MQFNCKGGRDGPQTQEHHTHVVGQLQRGLLKSTKQFQGVLVERTETMKAQSERRVLYGQDSPSLALGRPLNFLRHREASFKGTTPSEAEESVACLTQTRLMVRESNTLQDRSGRQM